ncbi:MAG: DUF3034 family protein [Deferribacterales bacterium]|nr:DUF3034 family protein [Deferribacterales bacterium]
MKNISSNFKKRVIIFTLSFMLSFYSVSFAGAPFTNVEGVGGGGLNPSANLAGAIHEPGGGLNGSNIVGKPNIAYWYVGIPSSDIFWNIFATNISFFNRLELGMSQSFANVSDPMEKAGLAGATDSTIHFSTYSAKLQLLKDGQFHPLVPAFSAGVIHKSTDNKLADSLFRDDSSQDFYIVFDKLLYKNVGLPMPVSLNFGVRWTKGYSLGLQGFGNDYDEEIFGSIAVFLPWPENFPGKHLILSSEYRGKTNVGEDRHGRTMKNGRMFDVTLVWEATEKLSFIASYLNAGGSDDIYESSNNFHKNAKSLGHSMVFSVQYQF